MAGASESADLVLDGQGFRDAEGRRVHFRGVNLAGNAKFPPFRPFTSPTWWDMLRAWGYNMVRLTIFWEAIEPQPGVYDQEYLRAMRTLVEGAARREIYVLLDMHQDLYSRWLKGDGAPDWALPSDIRPEATDSIGGQFWGTSYFLSRDVRACFTHFFRSKMLQEHYCKAWTRVVETVSGLSNILGFDLMNEPSGGDISNLTGDFENQYLKPFYQKVMTAIRQVRPEAVGFVEPHVLDTYTSRLEPFDLRDLVYAPHLYNSLSLTLRFNPLPDDLSMRPLLQGHIIKARYLRMPLFVGEFGAPWTMYPSTARDITVNSALQAMEGAFVDNAYWDMSVKNVDAWNEEDFSLIDHFGFPRGLKVNARPYIQRMKGHPIAQCFEPDTGVYRASFSAPPGLPPMVICLPVSVHYPEGFNVRVSDGSLEHDGSTQIYYYPRREGRHDIKIRPKRR